VDDPAQAMLMTRSTDFSGPEQNTPDHQVSNDSPIDALRVALVGVQ
jgi:hypothetical protein